MISQDTKTNTKPPTQGVGVEGFKSDVYAADDQSNQYIDWLELMHLPKFQMFVIEQSRKSYENVMDWIDGYVKDQVFAIGQVAYFDQYVKWHDAKGYWPNEKATGGIK